MMCELRKLFLLIEEFDIKIKTTYIRSASNKWADGLSRIKDKLDWKLKESKFARLNKPWGPVSIVCFASFENKHPPRQYTAKWRDGKSEAADSLYL